MRCWRESIRARLPVLRRDTTGGSSADELGSEIATAKANHARMVGAVLFFGGIILTLALGSDGTTWGLLSISGLA